MDLICYDFDREYEQKHNNKKNSNLEQRMIEILDKIREDGLMVFDSSRPKLAVDWSNSMQWEWHPPKIFWNVCSEHWRPNSNKIPQNRVKIFITISDMKYLNTFIIQIFNNGMKILKTCVA